jgi:membrane fusion protein (multidrug efflux system)
MRKFLPFAVILALATALAWWLWPRPPSGPGGGFGGGGPVMVETAVAEERDVTPTLQAIGSLRANEDVVLRPEIGGRVDAIRFTEGQRVARGVPLVVLDGSVYRAEVDKARVAVDLARRNHDRARDLLEKKLGSVNDRDVAEAALRSAEAELALEQARLAKATLSAPFAGIVGLRSVSPGDYVAAGQDLVRLVDLDTMKADFQLPESALPLLGDSDAVTVLPDALPGVRFEGKVYAVEPAVTETGRSLTLRARITNPEGRLKPGMFARIELRASQPVRGIVIPEAAIVPGSESPAVFRVTAGRAESVPVAVGERGAGWVQVTEGLAAGEVVVVAGQEKLRDGVPVATAPAG